MNRKILLDFLNKLGYNLQCHERPLAIMLEESGKNFMYILLFYKEYDTLFWKMNLRNYIENILNIKQVTHFEKATLFDLFLDKQSINGKSKIIYSDHYYNEKYSAYYKSKHYSHPFLLEQYNIKDNLCLIIDENIEKQIKFDKYNNWINEEKEVIGDELKNICCNWTNNDIHEIKYFYYTELILKKKEIPSNFEIEDILKEYTVFIDEIILKRNHIKEYYIKAFSDFFDEKNVNEKHPTIKLIYNHNKAINRQYRLIYILLEDDLEKDLVDFKRISELLGDKYLMIYTNLIKYSFNHSNELKENILNLYDKAFEEEKSFYELLKYFVNIEELESKIDILCDAIHNSSTFPA